MSKGEDIDVLVMDVEGTDGRERGEDQDFERKSALFSIAVSEVLLINIWEHQVGLYQGANMGLLKTVFEVNLGLFLAAKEKGKMSGSFVFLFRSCREKLMGGVIGFKTRRCFSSSFEITSARPPSKISAIPSSPTSPVFGRLSPNRPEWKNVSSPNSSTSISSLSPINFFNRICLRRRLRICGRGLCRRIWREVGRRGDMCLRTSIISGFRLMGLVNICLLSGFVLSSFITSHTELDG